MLASHDSPMPLHCCAGGNASADKRDAHDRAQFALGIHSRMHQPRGKPREKESKKAKVDRDDEPESEDDEEAQDEGEEQYAVSELLVFDQPLHCAENGR